MNGPQVLLLLLDGAGSVTGTGAIAFGFTVAATGTETVSGTAAVAFTFSEAATGTETITGTGAEQFGFAVAGSGAQIQDVTGTGAVAFGFAELGAGSGGQADGHHAVGLRYIRTVRLPVPVIPAVAGGAAVAFGFSVRARGKTNDDELALTLAA